MPNLFITRDVARAFFWEAIPNVCPKAFEELFPLVWDYKSYLEKTVDHRQTEDSEDQPETITIDLGFEDEGKVHDWQKRWNLSGYEERGWLSMLAITNLAAWAFDRDLRRQRRVFVAVAHTTRPVFEMPSLVIDEHEKWTDFRERVKGVYNNALADYRKTLEDVGAFQQKTRIFARVLAAHQVNGQSWKEIAISLRKAGESVNEGALRKGASRFAEFLPLTPRT